LQALAKERQGGIVKKVCVKTVYAPEHFREPGLYYYRTQKEAKMFIRTCLKWGIGIVSCEIVQSPVKKIKK